MRNLSQMQTLADFFSNQDNAKLLKPNASNAEVKSFLSKEATSAIDRSFIIIRSRIDGFGVVSPNMQKQEGTNRILIEMPGVQDKERVHKLLQGSAELQFWQVYQNEEVYPVLENINKTLAATLKSTSKDTASVAVQQKTVQLKAEVNLQVWLKLRMLKIQPAVKNQELSKSNPLFAVLNIPTYQGENGQPALRPGPVVGWVAQKDTAKVNAFFKRPEIASIIPQTYKFMWSVKPQILAHRHQEDL